MFQHPLFQQGKIENLIKMKRKVKEAKIEPGQKKEFDALVNQIKDMKSKQEQFDAQIFDLKAQNNHLDRENMYLWEAVNESKKRQDVLVSKMKKIVDFMKLVYQGGGGNSLPGFSDDMPKLIADAEKLSDAVEQMPSPLSKAKESLDGGKMPDPISALITDHSGDDNDLSRAQTIRTIPTISVLPDEIMDAPSAANLDASAPQPQQPLQLTDAAQGSSSSSSSSSAPAADSLNLGPADSLTRNASLQSFMDTLPQHSYGKYHGIAHDLGAMINNQDDAFRRLHSLQSTFPMSDNIHDDEFDDGVEEPPTSPRVPASDSNETKEESESAVQPPPNKRQKAN